MNKLHRNLSYSMSIVILAGIALFLINDSNKDPYDTEYHIHTDFKMIIEGEVFNFSQKKYMTTEDQSLYPLIHFHDMDGEVIHFHADNENLMRFLGGFNMKLNETCVVLDDGREFCEDEEKELKLIVNGEVRDITTYEPADLDRVLLIFSDKAEDYMQYFNTVTDRACIQSELCPERGTPSDEASCAAGTCTYSIN